VLPRKAPWIGKAGEMELADVLRPAETRETRLKPAG
jgi:hypothetical protein